MSSQVAKSRDNAVEAILPQIIETIEKAISLNGSAWLGIGTGTTISVFMEKLKARLKSDLAKNCFAVSTSFQSQQLIISSGMTLAALSQAPNAELDIAIDGADEVDSSGSFIIKGGGGAHLLEKIVALSAKLFIVIVDSDKVGKLNCLGHKWRKGIPLAIVPEAYPLVKKECEKMNFALVLRNGSGKIGPVISDQGHIVADLQPPSSSDGVFCGLMDIERRLSSITGVVEHGLFCKIAHLVVVGSETGFYILKHAQVQPFIGVATDCGL